MIGKDDSFLTNISTTERVLRLAFFLSCSYPGFLNNIKNTEEALQIYEKDRFATFCDSHFIQEKRTHKQLRSIMDYLNP